MEMYLVPLLQLACRPTMMTQSRVTRTAELAELQVRHQPALFVPCKTYCITGGGTWMDGVIAEPVNALILTPRPVATIYYIPARVSCNPLGISSFTSATTNHWSGCILGSNTKRMFETATLRRWARSNTYWRTPRLHRCCKLVDARPSRCGLGFWQGTSPC
jgi:hypothetical protein